MSPDILDFSMPRYAPKQIAVLDSTEQKDLEAFVLEKTDGFKLGVYLTLYTGLRLGEICALRWSDIDLRKSELKVDRTLQRLPIYGKGRTEIRITEPKTRTSIRTIPLPQFLTSLLTAQKLKAEGDDSYFLTGTKKYIEPSNYYMKYTRWLKRIGIDHYSFHALRHTFATRCIENGFDPKSLSEILGHSDVRITLNRYVHPSMELKRIHMERLSALCFQSTPQSSASAHI